MELAGDDVLLTPGRVVEINPRVRNDNSDEYSEDEVSCYCVYLSGAYNGQGEKLVKVAWCFTPVHALREAIMSNQPQALINK